MKNKLSKIMVLVVAVVLLLSLTVTSITFADSAKSVKGKYVAGDFHTHTYLTDGNKTEADVVMNAFKNFGLDWMANSEHGGAFAGSPSGANFANPAGTQMFDAQGKNIDYMLWRWISLRDYSYPIVKKLQKQYPGKVLIQGVEWNVPTHEHASVAIVADSANPVSDFEYMFDQNDKDTGREAEGITKANETHVDAVKGAKWLQDNYGKSSYFLLNHPSRKLKYSISDMRDFNNVAPDVFFGMEGFPGHQKEPSRGGYTSKDSKAQTYGGADYMTAKVGGLWDSLLGEGRKFWVFVNSDFHDNAADADFWPGEYAKSYTYVTENSAGAIVNGMRSGNSFAVQGDLINALDFKISRSNNTSQTMGGNLMLKGKENIKITIRFKSPAKNNNQDAVKVDHIDLISGDVTGKAAPGTSAYSKDTNDSTKVVKTFTSKDWKVVNGWNEITYEIKGVSKNMYFRLRGTNLGFNVANETDTAGNPLVDNLVGANDAAKAYADLWFYSNPIFVTAGK